MHPPPFLTVNRKLFYFILIAWMKGGWLHAEEVNKIKKRQKKIYKFVELFKVIIYISLQTKKLLLFFYKYPSTGIVVKGCVGSGLSTYLYI